MNATELNPTPEAKVSTASRFKKIVGDRLGIKPEPKIIFPPPSWFITDEPDGETPTSLTEDASPPPTSESTDEPEPPEPTTFALKIRQMIESLPLPASVTAAIGVGQVDQSGGSENNKISPSIDTNGPPIPDAVDDQTVRLLSSENVMNGDEYANPRDGQQSGVSYRQSIWSILERMKPGRVNTAAQDTDPPTSVNTQATQHTENPRGVMMYSPLEPTADSEVEIAESISEYSSEAPPVSNDENEGVPKPPATAMMETHWVPSTTKISVFTTWWGYRLYLPPPVMETLNSNQIKATQRATMITAALTWFLQKVPTLMIPAPMMPTIKVLRRLAPLLGYIGVFIAWSWARISECDKGNGVVLTATWLLPVALIPMAWDAGDIHGPPIRPPTPQETTFGSAQKDTVDTSNSKKEQSSKSYFSRFGF